MTPSPVEAVATALFAVALAHTFSTSLFKRLAHRHPRHANALHLLGEVEVVFGFWAMVLVLALFALQGRDDAVRYVDSRNFAEPLFVFAIMVIAGSRPIMAIAARMVELLAAVLPLRRSIANYFLALALLPLLGSFITEPAAMTLAALMLRDRVLPEGASKRLLYVTIGTLFVNVSIGGTLTPFAAPPVLMVAAKWSWELPFMLMTFGWKSALAVFVNATLATALVRRELKVAAALAPGAGQSPVPASAMIASALFLCGVVVFAHHPAIFMGLLLFFLGYSAAYPQHHDTLILREALLVAFFLAGLVVLGGMQQWWLQPLLQSSSPQAVFYGAAALTAITDNAALTYLGSLVEGLSDEFKYSLVAGAVAGGGLTVIANAPNPAGFSILRARFPDEAIHAGLLLAAAAIPTAVAVIAFRLLQI